MTEQNQSTWISAKNTLPIEGVPILLKVRGVVQHVTYALSESDNEWFEPYWFDHDDNCKISTTDKVYWQYLPESDYLVEIM